MVITAIPCQPCRPATRFLPSALTVTMFVTVAHLPGHDDRAVPTPVIVTGVLVRGLMTLTVPLRGTVAVRQFQRSGGMRKAPTIWLGLRSLEGDELLGSR